LDLSVNSSEIYGKSRTIGPSPIQNIKNWLYLAGVVSRNNINHIVDKIQLDLR
jgi:hypothetical protein